MIQARASSKPSAYRWIVFCLLAFGYLLVYFHRLCPAVVALDMQADLQTSGALLGFLAAAYFYPYALMQLPSGLLSDSWGPRKTITIFFALAGVSSIFLGLVGSLGLAVFARVLVGLGVAMLFVPTMKVMTNWFKTEEFARMTGILMAVGGLGAYSASRPLAWLSDKMGWRGSFITIGVVTLVATIAIWFLVRNAPEDMGLPAVKQPDQDNPQNTETIGLARGMKMVLSSMSFWVLAAWFFFSFSIFFSFGGLWGGALSDAHLWTQQSRCRQHTRNAGPGHDCGESLFGMAIRQSFSLPQEGYRPGFDHNAFSHNPACILSRCHEPPRSLSPLLPSGHVQQCHRGSRLHVGQGTVPGGNRRDIGRAC